MDPEMIIRLEIRFSQEIEDFFKSFMESADLGHPFKWESVSEATHHFRGRKYYNYVFHDKLIDFVIKLYDRYECNNESRAALISNMDSFMHSFDRDPARETTICKKVKERFGLDYKWDISQLMKLEYGECKICMPLDPLRNATSRSQENWIDFLNTHGVAYLPPIDDYCEWNSAKYFLFQMFSYQSIYYGYELDLKIYSNYGPKARKRLLIVFQGVSVLVYKRLGKDWESFARSLQKVFLTIPEPYITSREIRVFLHLVQISNNSASERVIQEISSEYENIFPESSMPKRPRSLFHLSRCQVRQNLRTAGTLPHGVKELQLPQVIEKSVLLRNCDIYKPHLN